MGSVVDFIQSFKAATKLMRRRLEANEAANQRELQGRAHKQPGADIKSSGASDQMDQEKDFGGFNGPPVGQL